MPLSFDDGSAYKIEPVVSADKSSVALMLSKPGVAPQQIGHIDHLGLHTNSITSAASFPELPFDENGVITHVYGG